MLDHLSDDEGYQATMRVLEAMGLDAINFDRTSAQPLEEQFWEQFDGVFNLTEVEMKKELPNFVTDPSNQAKVQAILHEHSDAKALNAENTQKLA